MVAVSGHTRHRHKPSPISAGFEPPKANTTLVFGPSALAASIARTATLRDAPPEMLARWGDGALMEVEWLVDDGGTFALSQYVNSLADAERRSFAGRVGAGVTDLLMNAASVVRWIDWVRNGGERPDEMSPVSFIQVPYAGRMFLACMETGGPSGDYPDWLDDLWHPGGWHHIWRRHRLRRGGNAFAGWFVMEEKAAAQFLDALSGIVRNGRENLPSAFELPRIDPVGFGIGGDEAGPTSADSEYRYALYGTALPCSAAQRHAE